MPASTCPRCGDPKGGPDMFACGDCWRDLPADVRSEIWRAYNNEGFASEEWIAAAKAAFKAWEMETPRWLLALEEYS